MENKDRSKILSGWHFKTFIITLIVATIGYLLFVIYGGWEDVLSAIYQVGFKGITVALILSLVNYALRFARWQLYLNALGVKIPVLTSMWIYVAGFALTTTPGKTGEAVRSVFLKEHGVSYRVSLGAFFSERASDLVDVVIISAFGLWIYSEAKPIIIIVGLILLSVILAAQNKKLLRWFEKVAKKILPESFAKLIEFGIEMVISFSKCYELKIQVIAIFLGVVAWCAEGYALYYLLQLLNVDISLSSTLFTYAFSLLVGSITFLPGGLGGAEVAMAELLKVFGSPLSITVAVTIIIRLATLWFSVFLGLISLGKLLLEKKHHN